MKVAKVETGVLNAYGKSIGHVHGDDAEPPIVRDPYPIPEPPIPETTLDSRDDPLFFVRDREQGTIVKHSEPRCESIRTPVEFCRTVKEGRIADLETVCFEFRSVFANSWEIPRVFDVIPSLCRDILDCLDNGSDISYPAEFGDEPSIGLEYIRDRIEDCILFGNPVQCCVGENGTERLCEREVAGILMDEIA
ncbi:hypothetical protein GCM10009000_081970 [Halobacterium noricense]|uniref:Uncharacterized protein n=1 Tax=Haladaptatus pallidirubidus TaxID=1008152 RepID=A0AAV3UPM3_9EURY